MAVPGAVSEPRTSADREGLVPFSVRLTARQGRWLDRKAVKSGRSSGEHLREILDDAIERETAK